MGLFHPHDPSHKFDMLSLVDFGNFFGFFYLILSWIEIETHILFFSFSKHSFYIGHQSIFF
jgi:hypothetical protein